MDSSLSERGDLSFKELKTRFNGMKTLRSSILITIENIHAKLLRMDLLYEDMIRTVDNNQLYMIGLDAYYFQKQFFRMEYNHLLLYYSMIANRLYFDYYKLFKTIRQYIRSTMEDKKVLDTLKPFESYPVYDNLDIYKEYDFEQTSALYNDIVDVLITLGEYYLAQRFELQDHRVKRSTGLNIDHFIYTFENVVQEMSLKIHLYRRYMMYFIDLHTKYLHKFYTKAQLILQQLNQDIKIDQNPTTSSTNEDDVPSSRPNSTSTTPDVLSLMETIEEDATAGLRLEESVIENPALTLSISSEAPQPLPTSTPITMDQVSRELELQTKYAKLMRQKTTMRRRK